MPLSTVILTALSSAYNKKAMQMELLVVQERKKAAEEMIKWAGRRRKRNTDEVKVAREWTMYRVV